MRALLMILALAAPAGAQQVFPEDVKDPSMLRNLEFLYDEVRVLSSSVSANSSTSDSMEWRWLADTVAVNDVGVGFSNLSSSVAYHLEWDLLTSQSANVLLTFNGDGGANYNDTSSGADITGSLTGTGRTGNTSCYLNFTTTGLNGGGSGEAKISTKYKTKTTVWVIGHEVHEGATVWGGVFGCKYVGSATLSSVRFSASGGNLNGVFKLFKRNGAAW